MKIERNGKAKLKPKMAMNSANQSATRLRLQSTVLAVAAGLAAGAASWLLAKQLENAVR
jgi:uncharacterized protein (DUF2062 family)